MARELNSFKAELVEQVFRRIWQTRAQEEDEEEEEEEEEEQEEVEDVTAQHRETDQDQGVPDNRSDQPMEHIRASRPSRGAAGVNKIHPKALQLSAELLRLFVVEAFHRAQTEAMVDGSDTIEPQHLEQILAQLLLDF